MDFTEIMIDFKDARKRHYKKAINVSLSADRLRIIDDALNEKSQFYKLLTRSEQLDFMLYTLERYMRNGSDFNIADITYSKGSNID